MCIRHFIFSRIIFCGLLWLLLGNNKAAYAQDSLRITGDSASIEKVITTAKPVSDSTPKIKSFMLIMDSIREKHSARRAAFYSAVLPGLGQIYNHQYIKVPLMLGGLGVATGVFMFNFNKYITYRDAYRLKLNGHITHNPRVDIYSAEDLRYLRDGYRQYVDYSVLGFAAVYLYNILDAVVFAHLYNFNVSNDLSNLRFGPVFDNQNQPYVGLGFTYVFKK